MGLKAQSGGHSQHALAYHLVWCTKYRRTVLLRDVGDRCKELVTQIASEIGCEIISIETDVDHVHVLVRLKLTHEVSEVVHRFKGATARYLFQEFPWLKKRLWGGHLWSPSYYVTTVGGAPLETVKKYVESQRAK
jgi:putative transposase